MIHRCLQRSIRRHLCDGLVVKTKPRKLLACFIAAAHGIFQRHAQLHTRTSGNAFSHAEFAVHILQSLQGFNAHA